MEAARRAAEHAKSMGLDRRLGNAEMEQADSEEMLGRWQEANQHWFNAKRIFASMNAHPNVITVLHHQALSAWNRRDAASALERIRESMASDLVAEDSEGIRNALAMRTTMQLQMPSLISPDYQEKSGSDLNLVEDRTPGRNAREEANLLELFASKNRNKGQLPQARTYLDRAFRICSSAKDLNCIADAEWNLGLVDEEEGRLQDAEGKYRHASQLHEAGADPYGFALAGARLGWLMFEENRIPECRAAFSDALNQVERTGNAIQELEIQEQRIDIELQMDPSQAHQIAKDVLEKYPAMLDTVPLVRLVVLSQLSLAKDALGDENGARQELSRRVSLGNSELPGYQLAKVLLARGIVAFHHGEFADAEQNLKAAQQLASQAKLLSLNLQIRLALAQTHLAEHAPSARAELNAVRADAQHRGFAFFLRQIQEMDSNKGRTGQAMAANQLGRP